MQQSQSLGFLTRSDSYWPAQSLKMARSLKFRIQQVDALYYPCSENKDANQLYSNITAQLTCRVVVLHRQTKKSC